MNYASEHLWKLVDKRNETPLVKSLYLQAIDKKPDFVAGQYLTVKLQGQGPAEGKAYSISSSPHEELLRISIKKVGAFSSALLSLPVGSTFTTSAPYGFFYPEPEDKTPLIFLAGGIGITPILSIIHNLHYHNDKRQVYLLYSNKTIDEIAFLSELTALETKHQPFMTKYCITREAPESAAYHTGRITPGLIKKFVSDMDDADFFLCGSMDFTKSLWKKLREYEIPAHRIYTEGFF